MLMVITMLCNQLLSVTYLLIIGHAKTNKVKV